MFFAALSRLPLNLIFISNIKKPLIKHLIYKIIFYKENLHHQFFNNILGFFKI
jgi:hypothetical protein